MKKEVYTITGSTGTIGSELVRLLSSKNVSVRAVMRNYNRIQEQLPNVHWVKANLSDDALLEGVLAGTTRLFILTGNRPGFGETQIKIIEEAKKSGIEHIVKLSALGASPRTKSGLAKEHYDVEQALEASGISFTILRPHAFMQNWLGEVAETVRKEKKIYAAIGDGSVPFIDARDIAAVAAESLLHPEKHNGNYYVLTSAKAINFYELAEALSQAIDEEVSYEALSMDEMRNRMQEQGISDKMIDSYLALAAYQKAGGATARTSEDVKNVLGRLPNDVVKFAEDYKENFR
ncbi:MAG TPA: NmrA family NAD(P)-binding protein [Brumimicrobium sp.]|nr:NmrA family NAD(P)-binding protein [Brumimicrobium sp.]